ncbi:MAG: J domain-containing protein [Rhodospirillales bacterium]|jgi:DnaJ-class molecular chaperone|nr:J domain-containing protein [Rhodospirillales bacterium]
MRDPYEVLGVTKGAEIKDVKKAYRKLARDLHPDLHPGDRKAEDRFKEVAAAYDFLSDAEKKGRYDRGEIDASGTPRAERTFYRDFADSSSGARYSDPREYFRDMDGMDIFADLFAGRTGGRGAPRMAGGDVRHAVEIDFLEAVNGGARTVIMADGKQLRVTIPPGSGDGDVLRLKGRGAPGIGGGTAGDLLIELRVRPHPSFTRKGQDIYAELPITLAEAVLGGKVEVQTVDGPVSLTVPKGSNTGSRLRVRGKGVPGRGGARGDHYVEFKVVLPQQQDPELGRLVEEWSAKHPYTVRGS